VLVGLYLVWVLLVDLRQPCPLWIAGHALHAAVAAVLVFAWRIPW